MDTPELRQQAAVEVRQVCEGNLRNVPVPSRDKLRHSFDRIFERNLSPMESSVRGLTETRHSAQGSEVQKLPQQVFDERQRLEHRFLCDH